MSEEAICSLYRDFSSEMKKWNDKFYPLMCDSVAEVRDRAASELKPIFDRYVWDDAKRRDDRLGTPSTEDPCDYDPETNTIKKIELSKSKSVIYVQTHAGFEDCFRYTFTKKGETWNIFKRELIYDEPDKWKSHYI